MNIHIAAHSLPHLLRARLRSYGLVIHCSCLPGVSSTNRLEHPPVIELVIRQVDVDTSSILLCHRCDQNTVTVEVLKAQAKCVDVVRVEEEHGIDQWGTSGVSDIHGQVDAAEELLAGGNSRVLLWWHARGLMLAVAWAEGAEHSPPSAEQFLGVAIA